MTKSKILHVASSYWPAFEFGGPIQSVHLLNKFLAKKGVDITVYTTNAGLRNNSAQDGSASGGREVPLKKEVILDGVNPARSKAPEASADAQAHQTSNGVKVFYFPYFGYRHYNFSPSLFWYLARHLKNFDLVHITGVWNFPIMAAAFWSRFYKKPYLISPRGSLMKEPLERKSYLKKKIQLWLFGKRDLKNASAIHFTTEAEKEEYLKANLPLKKAVVVPNGFDAEEFKEKPAAGFFREKFGIADDKKTILFLSRLSWKKGLDTLIPAFAEVIKKEPKAILVLAGGDDENYKKTIEKMIKENNVGGKVIFVGMISGKEKAAAYADSNVFVLPSYSENFGIAVVEAMSFGLPVVITKNVGIAPNIEKAGAGLVIEKDVNQLAEAILKILDNPDLSQKMGERGKYLTETEFSWPNIADEFIKEYSEIIEK